MKFLCLHGTDTNTHVLKMQLAPITFDLAQDSHTFTYLNGPISVSHPSPGLDPSIPGPFYRYYDRTQIDMDIFTAQFHDPSPSISTPEDRIRHLRSLGLEHPRSTSARDFVQDFAENSEEGPFDGIIAFSEGAAVAADVILLQARMKSSVNPFKCAVFICGAPPWDYDCQRYLLGDESEERIGIPSVSVVGARDQMRAAGLALWGFCDGRRVLYEHPLGHLVPRSLMGRKAMVGAVRGVVRRVEEREAEAEAGLERAGLEMSGTEMADSETFGSEISGSEVSGSEASSSETKSMGKSSLKKTSLENVGMHSEREDVVDMIC